MNVEDAKLRRMAPLATPNDLAANTVRDISGARLVVAGDPVDPIEPARELARASGVGDLVATCLSKQSRNHHVGEELGKGRKLEDIIASMNMVAEGVKSCAGILAMAVGVACDMPIASRVNKVLNHGADVKEMVDSLLTRDADHAEIAAVGPMTRYRDFVQPAGRTLIGVRFRPGMWTAHW